MTRHARAARVSLLVATLVASCGGTTPRASESVPPPSPAAAAPTDRDHDGLAEAEDVCPCEAEDVDGWQDDDGCPDPDNDGDHVPDPCDVCPNEPETYDGRCDGDGCPDGSAGLELRVTRIVIATRVIFARRSARLRPDSTPLLDEVALVMQESPELEQVAIVGSIEPAEARVEGLALARATAVRDALVERGVAATRLVVEAASTEPGAEPSTATLRAVRFVVRRMNGVAIDEESVEAPREPVAPRPECEVPVCDPPVPVHACG